MPGVRSGSAMAPCGQGPANPKITPWRISPQRAYETQRLASRGGVALDGLCPNDGTAVQSSEVALLVRWGVFPVEAPTAFGAPAPRCRLVPLFAPLALH